MVKLSLTLLLVLLILFHGESHHDAHAIRHIDNVQYFNLHLKGLVRFTLDPIDFLNIIAIRGYPCNDKFLFNYDRPETKRLKEMAIAHNNMMDSMQTQLSMFLRVNRYHPVIGNLYCEAYLQDIRSRCKEVNKYFDELCNFTRKHQPNFLTSNQKYHIYLEDLGLESCEKLEKFSINNSDRDFYSITHIIALYINTTYALLLDDICLSGSGKP